MKWPSKEEVLKAVKAWIDEKIKRHPKIIKIGLFWLLCKRRLRGWK